MRRRLAVIIVTLMATMTLAVGAFSTDFPPEGEAIDIDLLEEGELPGECSIVGEREDQPDDVHGTINQNWIIAGCVAQLGADDIEFVGGPFSSAQVYKDFVCLVGDDGLNFEDVVATRSHAVITPTGLAIVSCQAPIPATEAPPGFGPVDIDLLEEGELPGECSIVGGREDQPDNVHGTITQNWIIAGCVAQLDADDIEFVGGPFSSAQVYKDFECLVGDDGLNFEDVVATRSHAVITPTGLAIVSCQAPIPATEAPPGFGPVDIDLLEEGELPGECSIVGEREDQPDNVHGTINQNWIIAGCEAQLDADDIEFLGGPFSTAQVYKDFECLVGDDGLNFEDVVATRSHAVITPTGLAIVSCQAPTPATEAPPGFGPVDIDLLEEGELPGECSIVGEREDQPDNVHGTITRNWIIAGCEAQLDADHIEFLGGPFSTAQVYKDFECLVGDDGLNFEDVVATRSHAVITPTGLAIVSCQAPTP